MMLRFAATIFIILIQICVISNSHLEGNVFESESLSFCQYDVQGTKLRFNDKLWKLETNKYDIYVQFCKEYQKNHYCPNQNAICIRNKESNTIINLGNGFQSGTSKSDDLLLQSSSLQKCPHSKTNYTLNVILGCSPTMEINLHFVKYDEQNCTLTLQMMRSDCEPECTTDINGSIIDMRPLVEPVDFQIGTDKISVSICRSNAKCGGSHNACIISSDNSTTPLGTHLHQFVKYDSHTNALTAGGAHNGAGFVHYEVVFRCNWDVKNLKSVGAKKLGNRYVFVVESAFGCVKLPTSCVIKGIDNFQYNLTELNRVDGWKVSNVSNREIRLNVCGPLKLSGAEGVCLREHSQVCETSNGFINRGSVLLPFTIDGVIKATFTSGSACQKNERYSTQIEFRCSKFETGPVFQEYQGCVMKVVWDTPYACPLDLYKGQDCYVNDRVGNRNLKLLWSEINEIHPVGVAREFVVMYNFCGPLIDAKCNGFVNASFCLLNPKLNKEWVIGWENTQLISNHGALSMEFEGENCYGSHGKVHVNFQCNYQFPPPLPHFKNIKTCQLNMTVYTQLACLSPPKFSQCEFHFGKDFFNLSSLASRDTNHVAKVNSKIDLIFNVCGPVITSANAFCLPNTVICLRNKTAPHIKHQFISLGKVVKEFTYENNSLTLKSSMGALCNGFELYKSQIVFSCSRIKQRPRAVKTGPCSYSVIFKTPLMCPPNDCSDLDLSGFDFTGLNKKTFEVSYRNGTEKYVFNLCKPQYQRYKDKNTNLFPLSRKVIVESKETILVEFSLSKDGACHNNSINIVGVLLQCNGDREDESFEEGKLVLCTQNFFYYTKLLCSNDSFGDLEPTIDFNSIPARSQDCSDDNFIKEILNFTTEHPFRMIFERDIHCLQVNSGDLCMPTDYILPMVGKCPNITFGNNSAILKYALENVDFEIQYNCAETLKAEYKMMKKVIGQLIFIIKANSSFCKFEHQASISSLSIVLVCIGCFTFLLITIVVVFYLKRQERRSYVHMSEYSNEINFSKIMNQKDKEFKIL